MSHSYVSSLYHCVWSTMEDGTSLAASSAEYGQHGNESNGKIGKVTVELK
jgi:hypothetical protein